MGNGLKRIVKMLSQKGGFCMFLRAQLSAQIATVIDFSFTIVLAELSHLYYLYATLIGAIAGGVSNSIINYRWTFKSNDCKKKYVACKYALVWLGSIALNTYGTYALTELMRKNAWVRNSLALYFDNYFILAKIAVAIVVALFWNYYMQKIFVYRNVSIKSIFRKTN